MLKAIKYFEANVFFTTKNTMLASVVIMVIGLYTAIRAEEKSYDVVLGTDLHIECLNNTGALNYAERTWTKNGESLVDCGVPGRLHIDVTTKWFVDIREVEICDIGTYKCCTTVAITVCNQHTVRVLVFRGASGRLGGSNELYSLWINSGTANTNDEDASKIGGKSNLHYKSEIVEKWDDYDIENVKLSVYEDGFEKAFFVFNGINTDKKTWMSPNRLVQSSYDDVVGFSPSSSNGYYVSVEGNDNRKFFINKYYASCYGDNGWLVVVIHNDGCSWGKTENRPNIVYSPTEESTNWNNGGRSADELIISLLLRDASVSDETTHSQSTTGDTRSTSSKYTPTSTTLASSTTDKDASVSDETTHSQPTTGDTRSTSSKYTPTSTTLASSTTNKDASVSDETTHSQPTTGDTRSTSSKYTPTSTTLASSTTDKDVAQCMCPCENIVQNTQQFYTSLKNYEKEELRAILQPMLRATRKAMAVNKSNTSKHQRKLYSAPDGRRSSQLLGITGITAICIVFGLIVLIDVTSVCRRLRIDFDSIRRRLRFLGVPQNN